MKFCVEASILPLNRFGFDSKYLCRAGFFDLNLTNISLISLDDEYTENLMILRTMQDQVIMCQVLPQKEFLFSKGETILGTMCFTCITLLELHRSATLIFSKLISEPWNTLCMAKAKERRIEIFSQLHSKVIRWCHQPKLPLAFTLILLTCLYCQS